MSRFNKMFDGDPLSEPDWMREFANGLVQNRHVGEDSAHPRLLARPEFGEEESRGGQTRRGCGGGGEIVNPTDTAQALPTMLTPAVISRMSDRDRVGTGGSAMMLALVAQVKDALLADGINLAEGMIRDVVWRAVSQSNTSERRGRRSSNPGSAGLGTNNKTRRRHP
jgi:hypothetical protein